MMIIIILIKLKIYHSNGILIPTNTSQQKGDITKNKLKKAYPFTLSSI
jgi:hypothetical protein